MHIHLDYHKIMESYPTISEISTLQTQDVTEIFNRN